MKKRILSLFLAVVMCLGMITTAYAVEPTVKLAVTADKTSAKVGEVVTFTVTCTSTKKLYGLEAKLDIPSGFTYIANSGALADGVVDEIGGTSDSKFLEANKHIWLENTTTPMTITGTVTLATFQCTASASGTSTVSLTGVSGVDDEFNSFTYSVAGVDVIVKAELTGDLPVTITKPAKGDTPETTISGTNFTGSITWSPAVAAGGKFAANTVYTAKVELTANTGYQFANGVNPTVAGSDSVTDVNVKDSGSKLEFKATFPKTVDKDPLTGTVSITGSPKIGQPLTADTSALPTDAGALTYKWYRDGETAPISSANTNTYTPSVAADVGKQIKVEVSAANYSGSVTSAPTAAVAKAAGPAAPAGLAEVSKTDTTITVTPNAVWEYSKDNGATWQDSNVFTGLTANTTYSQIVARVKATGTHEASTACTAISVTTAKSSATITIDDPGTIVYDGSAVEAGTSGKDLNYANSGDGAVTVKWYADNGGSVGSALSGAPTNAGTYWIGVSAAEGTSSAAVSEVTKKFTISRAAYTYTYTGTTAASIGSARPTSGSATANGVGVESVSGTLTWYTDSACTNPAAGNFTATGTEDLYWQFAPAASEKNYVTTLQTGKVTFHVTALPAQTVTFADPGPIAKNFGDANFLNTANNSTPSGGAITYSVDNTAVAEVNSTGEVTIKGAGTATITATAAATTGYAETKVSYTLNVSPKTITPSIVLAPATFEYDGTDKEPAVAVNDGALVLTAADYTVEYENNRNAGTAKVIVKPAAGGNYTWTPAAEQTFTITPKGLDQSAFTWSTAVSFPYDGNAHSVTLTNLPEGVSATYTDNAKTYVGSYTASAVLSVDANHTLTGTLATCAWGITPAADPAVIGAAAAVLTGKTVDLSANVTGAMGDVSYAIDSSAALAGCSVDSNTGIFTAGATDGSCTVTVTVAAKDVDGNGTDEYSGATGSITVTVQNKTDVSGKIAFSDGELTYNGSEQTYENASIDGITPGANPTWTYTYTAVSGTLSGGKPKTAGTYTVSATYEDDDNYGTANATLTILPVRVAIPAADTAVYTYDGTVKTYGIAATADYTVTGNTQTNANEAGYTVTVALTDKVNTTWADGTTADQTYTFKIMKATPTGTPNYTKITTSGKKLSDAALASGSITPAGGSIAWDMAADTVVAANTAYGWTYTPADTANYKALTGSLTPYTVSHSGGGGGGSYTPSYSITVDKTENGTITVSPKSASKGDTVTITVKPDKGYELEMLKALDKDGDALKLTEKNGKYTFKMPSGKVTVKGSFVEEAPVQIFKDVPVDAYYYEAVKWAAEKGITGGVGNGLFGPNDPCTRAQIVTFLWRAAGSPAPKSMNSFADVPADAYYAKAVAWAVENGITSGTGSGKFSPDAACTRAQCVTFLYRAAGSPAVSGSPAFSDVASDAYYAKAVKWAQANGITTGIGGGLFGSNDNCTRAQIVTFIYRYMEK